MDRTYNSRYKEQHKNFYLNLDTKKGEVSKWSDNALENKASLGHSVQRPESCHLTTPEMRSLQKGARR